MRNYETLSIKKKEKIYVHALKKEIVRMVCLFIYFEKITA